MEAKLGDVIICQGRKVIIGEIISQYQDLDGYWGIEGKDTNGKYFIWKQRFDGGKFIKSEN